MNGIRVALLAAALGGAGCWSTTVQMTRLSNVTPPPKSADNPIEIVVGEPKRPYVLLASVSSFQPVGWTSAADGSEAMAKITEKAREVGGDAIAWFESYTAPMGTQGAGGFSAQGKIVAWK